MASMDRCRSREEKHLKKVDLRRMKGKLMTSHSPFHQML